MAQIKFKVNVGYSGYDFIFDKASDAADFIVVAVSHIYKSKATNIGMEVVLMDDDYNVETDD